MKGSMHKFMNGYGYGSQPVDLLEADRMRHHTIKDDMTTNKMRSFDAEHENPNYHDRNISRQRGRGSHGTLPRGDNHVLSSSSHGKKGVDTFKDSFTRNEPRALRLSLDNSARAENWHLTSADFGSIRKGERPSQPHQEDPMFKLLDPHAKKRKEARQIVREARESRKHASHHSGVKQRKAVYNHSRYKGDTTETMGVAENTKGTETSRTAISLGGSKGRTRHPLSTPHGVEKYWDHDDAVKDMEIAKRYKGVKAQYI